MTLNVAGVEVHPVTRGRVAVERGADAPLIGERVRARPEVAQVEPVMHAVEHVCEQLDVARVDRAAVVQETPGHEVGVRRSSASRENILDDDIRPGAPEGDGYREVDDTSHGNLAGASALLDPGVPGRKLLALRHVRSGDSTD
jgi:hypothetical protein